MTASIVGLILRSGAGVYHRAALRADPLAASRRMSGAGLMFETREVALLTIGGINLSRSDQRQGFVALEQVKQAAQRLAARALKLRIILHDAQRFVARLRDQLAVHVGARDPIAGQPALSYAEHVAFAAKFQIFFGNPEAVGGFPDRLQPRPGHLVEWLPVKQKTGRTFGAAPDPAAQLMQLRQPKA